MTIQRFISGSGHLSVTNLRGKIHSVQFKSEGATKNNDIEVRIGEIMQWSSLGPEPLVYYEICEPPMKRVGLRINEMLSNSHNITLSPDK